MLGSRRRSASTGKQLVDARKRPRAGAAELAADEEVLLDCERGEQPPPLRHEGDAARDGAIGRTAADRGAVEADGVAARAHQPGDAREQRALAGAVGADHGYGLAGLDLHRHREQRLEIAVERVEPVDFEQEAQASAAIPR